MELQDANISIELGLGKYLEYLTEKAISAFSGKHLSEAHKISLEAHTRRSAHRSGSIQCIGMTQPVPLNSIYQPTKLRKEGDHPINASDLLKIKTDIVIRGGPGFGKTTTLHWMYVYLLNSKKSYPLLFTLRNHDELDFLGLLCELAGSGTLQKTLGKKEILFLIDGYDEIEFQDRKRVSHILRDLGSLTGARFILTCRSFYDIIDIRSHQYYVLPFGRENAASYIEAFSSVYGKKIDSGELLTILEQRGLTGFLFHPLLLTLVCILHSSASGDIPRRAITLIRKALDVLCLKWDYEKGVSRESAFSSLDGDDRLRCLMYVAFQSLDLVVDEITALNRTSDYLKSTGANIKEPRKLLMEIAQWYGIFVPIDDSKWAFTHRSIHDFLAARYWIESGLFAIDSINSWTTRAAYAAALSYNATDSLAHTLSSKKTLPFAVEILSNTYRYDVDKVADSVRNYYAGSNDYSVSVLGRTITATTGNDLFGLMSDTLLAKILSNESRVLYGLKTKLSETQAKVSLFLFSFGAIELDKRGQIGLAKASLKRLSEFYKGKMIVIARRLDGTSKTSIDLDLRA